MATIRTAKMSDYGITEKEDAWIKSILFHIRASDWNILIEALKKTAPGLESQIYHYLTTGEGYQLMKSKGWRIPAKADDFYGYSRKVRACFFYMKVGDKKESGMVVK